MLYTFIVVIHVLICFLMIGAILLQSGKGAEIGASFGGSSQTVFGSRGPANFLSKLTVVVAGIFMVTSFSLAILAKQRNFSSTVIDMQPKSESVAPPTTPAQPSAVPTQPSPESHPAGESPSAGH
jgi:preprotein translocase subunit SecG